MKKSNYSKIALFVALCFSLCITFYACNKMDTPSHDKELGVNSEQSDITSARQDEYLSGIQGNRKMAVEISKDSLWKNLKHITDEMTAILISNDIDLKDRRNLNEVYFYSKLGKDADLYKARLRTGKKYAGQLRSKYFSSSKICSDCSTISEERLKRYAQKLDELKNKTKYVIKTTSITTSSEVDVPPGCWNWQFFACGTLCASTVEAPPLFALCMALCVNDYCF